MKTRIHLKMNSGPSKCGRNMDRTKVCVCVCVLSLGHCEILFDSIELFKWGDNFQRVNWMQILRASERRGWRNSHTLGNMLEASLTRLYEAKCGLLFSAQNKFWITRHSATHGLCKNSESDEKMNQNDLIDGCCVWMKKIIKTKYMHASCVHTAHGSLIYAMAFKCDCGFGARCCLPSFYTFRNSLHFMLLHKIVKQISDEHFRVRFPYSSSQLYKFYSADWQDEVDGHHGHQCAPLKAPKQQKYFAT